MVLRLFERLFRKGTLLLQIEAMKLKISKNLLLTLLVFVFACGGSDDEGGPGTEPTIRATNVTVTDLDNNADGSDFKVSFNVSINEDAITGYRAYVVKAAANSFNLALAETLPASSYVNIAKTGQNISTNLSATLLDVAGNAIVEGEAYLVYILSLANGTNATVNQVSGQSNQITLANTDILEILAELPIGTGGVEVDSDGNIYCSDFGRSLSSPPGTLVYKVTPDGSSSIFASGLVGASGNTFGPDGNFYQSNIGGGSVSSITAAGQVSTFVTGMSSPVGIVFDPVGNLYVANCGDNTIKKVDTNGEVTTFSSGTLFNCPNGITIDNDGNFYVANFSNSNVIKIDSQGTPSIFASFAGNNNGHITFFEDNLYVVARAANRIFRLDLEGNSTVIAGSGARGHTEGPALEAGLSLPNDLMFSADGQFLYINDAKPLSTSDFQPTYLKRLRFKRE